MNECIYERGMKRLNHFTTSYFCLEVSALRVMMHRNLLQFAISLVLGTFAGFFARFIRLQHKSTCVQMCSNATLPTSKRFIFVGVMTAEKFLDNRAKAVYETWGSSLPGALAFFSSGSSRSSSLPVVSLKGVDDSYPPQRKSMMMLKYMHDNYINDYEWFMRCDDDVYVRTGKLEQFLRTLNSTEDLYIGQAGTGSKHRKKYLQLKPESNYCMGGPGVIFSASMVRKFVQHVGSCLQSAITHHEDVEVGRCMEKFIGQSCIWSLEVCMTF